MLAWDSGCLSTRRYVLQSVWLWLGSGQGNIYTGKCVAVTNGMQKAWGALSMKEQAGGYWEAIGNWGSEKAPEPLLVMISSPRLMTSFVHLLLTHSLALEKHLIVLNESKCVVVFFHCNYPPKKTNKQTRTTNGSLKHTGFLSWNLSGSCGEAELVCSAPQLSPVWAYGQTKVIVQTRLPSRGTPHGSSGT